MSLRLPRPGKTLKWMMAIIFTLWVILTIGVAWLESPAIRDIISVLVGSNAVWEGQLWRLVTAPFIHWGSPGHVLVTLLGLYFLAPSLEERWGSRRMAAFLVGSAVFAFILQLVVGALVPKVAQPIWFGGLGMIEAIAVAWALAYRNSTVNLFFVLPVSGTMLLLFVFGMSVLHLIALDFRPEGLITPFGGMLAGYLFGDASPLRRFFLQMRLKRLQAEAAALQRNPPRSRASGPVLRVIPGGQQDPPKDKRYLN